MQPQVLSCICECVRACVFVCVCVRERERARARERERASERERMHADRSTLNIYSFYTESSACFAQADKYTFQVNGTIAEKTREMRELDAKLSEP